MVKHNMGWIKTGVWVIVYCLNSCRDQQKDSQLHNDSSCLVASVNGYGLYKDDLQAMSLSQDTFTKAHLLDQYIDDWAFKKLLMVQGKRTCLDSHVACIENQVNNYKADLLAYYFLEDQVNKILSKEVLPQEIADYYTQHKWNFLLNHDLVKGLFVVMPIKHMAYVRPLKALMLSDKHEDFEKLKQYCLNYAKVFTLEPNTWFVWTEMLAKMGYYPQDALRLLKTNKFIHRVGRHAIYLFKIDQYQASGKVAPLEMVKQRIEAIILHKRRLLLNKEIKRKFLQDAKKNKIYIRYTS